MPSDFRPPKRHRDPQLLRELHMELVGEACEACQKREGTQLHHLKFRSHSGPDKRFNLRWLCRWCHGALHGNPYVDADGKRWDAESVRAALLP